MGAWTYFEVVCSSWMVWFAGLFVLFFCFLFFLMFPYCVIVFYSWTYFEEDVVVCGDPVQRWFSNNASSLKSMSLEQLYLYNISITAEFSPLFTASSTKEGQLFFLIKKMLSWAQAQKNVECKRWKRTFLYYTRIQSLETLEL